MRHSPSMLGEVYELLTRVVLKGKKIRSAF